MPAKSKKNSKAASTPTRCEAGGKELLPVFLTVRQSDTISLTLTLCKSAFRVSIFLDDQLRVDEEIAKDEVKLVVSSLPPGKHALHWFYLAAALTWQIKSEVMVGTTTLFRQRKSDQSSKPYNKSSLFFEVV